MNVSPDRFLPFFPICFVALWVSVGFIISRMGWHAFALKYPSSTRPPGRSFNCRSAWFGTFFASYRNVVRVIFCEAGIYVYPLILFRAFHPPFLVPWEKVVGVTKKKRFFVVSQELEIRDENGEMHVLLSDAAAREAKKFENV